MKPVKYFGRVKMHPEIQRLFYPSVYGRGNRFNKSEFTDLKLDWERKQYSFILTKRIRDNAG